MSAIDRLLARLDGVKSRGDHKWVCKCPAHADSSPSMSIRVADNGTVLIHCFAGCEPNDILAAVGMNIRDLFPEALGHHLKKQAKRGINPMDLLRTTRFETIIIGFIAEQIARGETDPALCRRAHLAAERINYALTLCDG